jgi:hypothetical protein
MQLFPPPYSGAMMESLHSRIVTCLIERAPNSLTLNNLSGLLPGVDIQAIEEELQALVTEGVLRERASAKTKDYLLSSYETIPTREFISLNGMKLPRLIAGDIARPEDVNIFFETLAHRLLEVEAAAEEKLNERLKSYWGNVVTLFGAFIGVFSLIVGFVKTIPIEKDATFMSVLSIGTAQVLPFAIVLAGFVWFLKWQFK